MSYAQNLSHCLRKGRIKKGLSLKQVGKIIGKDPSQIWRWENGKSGVPVTKFAELIDLYGMSIDD